MYNCENHLRMKCEIDKSSFWISDERKIWKFLLLPGSKITCSLLWLSSRKTSQIFYLYSSASPANIMKQHTCSLMFKQNKTKPADILNHATYTVCCIDCSYFWGDCQTFWCYATFLSLRPTSVRFKILKQGDCRTNMYQCWWSRP